MNFFKTTLLLAVLTGILVAVGGLIGGVGGMVLFLILAAAMNFFAFWFSDKMALRMAGAREVSESEAPRLHAMVREVANLANMPMPRVFIVQNDSPNAFATGRSPSRAVVAVTTGIQRILSERELRAVIGHEMGHVKNRDILTSSIVAATLIQLGISRTREYAADRTGAEITHDPEALASALEKLHRGAAMMPMEATPNQEAVSALYIVHPFAGGGMANLFSTHPPMEERIKRLRQMTYRS